MLSPRLILLVVAPSATVNNATTLISQKDIITYRKAIGNQNQSYE